MSMRSSAPVPYDTKLYSRPLALTGEPWVRWPPWSRLRPEHRVARLQQRLVDAHVGVGARVRLHVGVIGAEQRLDPVDRQLLDVVDDRVAAVVALARVALGVLVGQHRAGRGHHRRRGEVLAGDQLEAGRLAFDLALDQFRSTSVSGWVSEGNGMGLRGSLGVSGRSRLRVWVSWSTRRAWRPPSKSVERKVVDDLLGEAHADDPGTDRQHVGVVVGTGHAGGVEAVAQRRAHAAHLVGGELLALAAPAEHDADVGIAVADGAADPGTDRRIVDRVGRVGALVVDLVALQRSAASTRCCLSS